MVLVNYHNMPSTDSVQSVILFNLKCPRLSKFQKAARPPLGPKIQRDTNVQLGNRGLPYSLSHLQ